MGICAARRRLNMLLEYVRQRHHAAVAAAKVAGADLEPNGFEGYERQPSWATSDCGRLHSRALCLDQDRLGAGKVQCHSQALREVRRRKTTLMEPAPSRRLALRRVRPAAKRKCGPLINCKVNHFTRRRAHTPFYRNKLKSSPNR